MGKHIELETFLLTQTPTQIAYTFSSALDTPDTQAEHNTYVSRNSKKNTRRKN